MRFLLLLFIILPSILQAQKDSIQEIEGVEFVFERKIKLPTLEDEYVLDYIFYDDDCLLLSKIKDEYCLRLVNDDFKEQTRLNIAVKPEEIYTDCMGYKHLITRDSAYQIYIENKQLFLLFPQEKDHFLGLLENCVGTTGNGLVYETFMHKNQTHMFIEFDTVNAVNNLLYVAQDMENYYSLREDQLRLEADWASSPNNLAAMGIVFNHMVLSKEAYVPFFNLDTGFLILNHRVDLAIKGNNFTSKEVFPIVYHKKESWADHIIQSENGDVFYAKLLDGGLLEIENLGKDLKSVGKVSKIMDHTFPQKLKVKDGFLYYIAKEYKESTFVKLWKVKL